MTAASCDKRHGGKAFGLRRVQAAGFDVPPFEVVGEEHFAAHLADARAELETLQSVFAEAAALDPPQQRAHIASAARALRDRIVGIELAKTCTTAIDHMFTLLGTHSVAVRSDMRGEDSETHSYAGQLDSYLFVDRESIEEAVLRCWASAFSDRALLYSMRSGIAPQSVRMCVVIQEMISADAAGVAFSIDPSTGEDHCIIAAAWGVGEGVVAGTVDSDEYRWSPISGEMHSAVPVKDSKVSPSSSGGTEITPVDDHLRADRVLAVEQVGAIGTMCKQLEKEFGMPVDLEWCVADRRLYVLQARPITSRMLVDNAAAPATRAYDNSNIQESFNGYTTPLTFSFASYAYQRVFMDFVRCVGVSKARREDFEVPSRAMLAYLNGRIYYNLSSWYRMLALLPWYETNRQETEKVMWHLEETGDPLIVNGDRLLERVRKIWVGLTVFGHFTALRYTIPRFIERFTRWYSSVDRQVISNSSLDDLHELLRVVYQDIMNDWRVPNINDLKVMMACGRLRRIVEQANIRGSQLSLADLLTGIDGIESLRPTEHVRGIAARVRADTSLADLFNDEELDPSAIWNRLQHSPIRDDIDEYVQRYGDRSAGELKLETVTVRDRPELLVATIRAHVIAVDQVAGGPDGRSAYRAARRRLKKAVPLWRRLGLDLNLRVARRAVADRERLRLLRTYAFGIARDIYRACGQRLHEHGVLDHPEDVYYLTIDEIASFCEGRAVSSRLSEIVAARRSEHTDYAGADLPNRVNTAGIPYLSDLTSLTELDELDEASANLTVLVGLGCAPGRVEAPAVVVHDPHSATVLNTVICAVRTDPGWAPLFPAAAGLVVERGSTLSHSAVIARELGIPTVVGVNSATRIINDGEIIRVDGDRGEVSRLGLIKGVSLNGS